eukprot:TRINITY_DN16914_c0_g4_i1.p1 TRINITY_DN16914_c0_g4~~TRINITY_DN16914_c0_g4_i1.p1  ORF type:complete len:512 (-),score=164.27 TRINITY_DN16914_c0_g4_i1:269-1804(-)
MSGEKQEGQSSALGKEEVAPATGSEEGGKAEPLDSALELRPEQDGESTRALEELTTVVAAATECLESEHGVSLVDDEKEGSGATAGDEISAPAALPSAARTPPDEETPLALSQAPSPPPSPSPPPLSAAEDEFPQSHFIRPEAEAAKEGNVAETSDREVAVLGGQKEDSEEAKARMHALQEELDMLKRQAVQAADDAEKRLFAALQSEHEKGQREVEREREAREAEAHRARQEAEKAEEKFQASLREAGVQAKASEAAAVANDRLQALAALESTRIQVKALEEVFSTTSTESRRSHWAHQLAMVVLALDTAAAHGGASLAGHLSALEAAASFREGEEGLGEEELGRGQEEAALLQAVVAALQQRDQRAGEGALTAPATQTQLQQRLLALEAPLRSLALLPGEAGEKSGGMLSHALAALVARVKIPERGTLLPGGGAEAALARAHQRLAADDLAGAAAELAGEDGQAAPLGGGLAAPAALEWAEEARRRAELEQGCALLRAHAATVTASLVL